MDLTTEKPRKTEVPPRQTNLNTLEESLRLATPAWPLQNIVAVNPFWFMRHKHFVEAVEETSPAVHARLFMPISYYIELFRNGTISESALKQSLAEARARWPELPKTVDELIRASREQDVERRQFRSLAECVRGGPDWLAFIRQEVGKYAAAFLDEKQALTPFPWRHLDFWAAWIEAQKVDRTAIETGLTDLRNTLAPLEGKTSERAIGTMLNMMGVYEEAAQIAYQRRLIASVLGWSTQFKYAEWQRQLGYEGPQNIHTSDLLAVRMAYDLALYRWAEVHSPPSITNWKNSLREVRIGNGVSEGTSCPIQYVFLKAAELTYQNYISVQIKKPRLNRQRKAKAQIAFCIDVRSEMLRRHIEQKDDSIATIGFAGFFGVPMDYKKIGQGYQSHRLPVLLTPALKVEEVELPYKMGEAKRRIHSDLVSSYFRNLRKNPLSSFLYVELFGAMYIEKMVGRAWSFIRSRLSARELPDRFAPHGTGPSQTKVTDGKGQAMNLTSRVERAAFALGHMGLTREFAELVIFAGHGSATTNNAFGSSLDCGACGGHAGDINARFLADLLNDSIVRKELRPRGIDIPDSTWFLAAVHETVTDELYILDKEKVPSAFQKSLASLEATLVESSESARDERLYAVSPFLDPHAQRRSHNWSEVRPEWGLTRNACFIVAPRERTRGINLESRSFLHNYDWRRDSESGYKTLELIMTAPMVVTNWINMQYYASTVAPRVYGSGNKVLHNIVNETGVVEGNGGDLRIGLPIQSVHDGRRFVHDPLRLSVFIEAPREEIEKIIAKHQVVRELVDNGWLHILHIDPASGDICRRSGADLYSPT